MHHLLERLNTLVRPRLLIRAARFGLDDYRRDRDLRRILKAAHTPHAARALEMLLEEELRLEGARTGGDANYSVARHVEVLIAVIAEAQLLRAQMPVQLLAAE